MKLARLLLLPILLLTFDALQPASTHAEGGSLSISGTIWQDTNTDGIRQPNEPGMPNVLVELGTTYNGQYFYTNAAGQPLYSGKDGRPISTDAKGTYSFEGLNPGPYSVRILGKGGFNPYFQTSPSRRGAGEYSTATTLDSRAVAGIDFGLIQPTGVRIYRGLAWLDAASTPRPAVHAFIDGRDCTAPGSLLPTDLPQNAFVTGVLPESLVPGCGALGRTVNFTINGRAANETFDWTPPPVVGVSGGAIPMPGSIVAPLLPPPDSASDQRWIDISAGVPFAYITAVPLGDTYLDGPSISADIDGVECGRGYVEAWGTVYLIIASDQATSGCGHEGLYFFVLQDGVTVAGPIPWSPGSPLALPLPLTGKPRPSAPTSDSDSNQ